MRFGQRHVECRDRDDAVTARADAPKGRTNTYNEASGILNSYLTFLSPRPLITIEMASSGSSRLQVDVESLSGHHGKSTELACSLSELAHISRGTL